MSDLTPRQTEILRLIQRAINETGMPRHAGGNRQRARFQIPERRRRTSARAGAQRRHRARAGRFARHQAHGHHARANGSAAHRPCRRGPSHSRRREYRIPARHRSRIFQPKPHYLLKVVGMSMKDAGILDGDLVAVHRTPEVRNRQIIVARLENEVTVKRYKQDGAVVWLHARERGLRTHQGQHEGRPAHHRRRGGGRSAPGQGPGRVIIWTTPLRRLPSWRSEALEYFHVVRTAHGYLPHAGYRGGQALVHESPGVPAVLRRACSMWASMSAVTSFGLTPDGSKSAVGRVLGRERHRTGRSRACSSSAPRRAPTSRTWAKAFAWPTCSIPGATCSASSRTRTSSYAKGMKRASGSFEVTRAAAAQTQKFRAIRCWAVCCSPRNSAAISMPRRVGTCCRRAPPVKGSAGYVAIDQVTGSLDGRKGSFVLQHSGSMKRGAPTLSIMVVPDSGTDELTGLTGTAQHQHRRRQTFLRLPLLIPRELMQPAPPCLKPTQSNWKSCSPTRRCGVGAAAPPWKLSPPASPRSMRGCPAAAGRATAS